MVHFLHIQAPPRGERSPSRAIAIELSTALANARPGLGIDLIDVWQERLPPFDGAALAAKHAVLPGARHGAEEARAWARVKAAIDRLDSADALLSSFVGIGDAETITVAPNLGQSAEALTATVEGAKEQARAMAGRLAEQLA